MKIETILSKNVKNFSKKAGFTQEELSAVAGVSLSVIHTIEYKTSWPEIGTLEKLAKVFKCDTARLFRDERLFNSENLTKAFIELTQDLQKFQNNVGKEVVRINELKKPKKP